MLEQLSAAVGRLMPNVSALTIVLVVNLWAIRMNGQVEAKLEFSVHRCYRGYTLNSEEDWIVNSFVSRLENQFNFSSDNHSSD